jgi:tetraacyldisaccharide 4'-kinase
LPAFVISVGNLVVGGTGKTPLTLLIAEYLHQRGLRVAILSRGYGRSNADAAKVPDSGETYSLVRLYGDEPVLMARKVPGVPVWVGRDRYHTGLLALKASHPQVLILDDGFQHLSLQRDVDLVLLDAHSPFGNGKVLPFGPLREPVEHLERASAFVLTRAENPDRTRATRNLLTERFPGRPVFACRRRLTEPAADLGGSRAALGHLAGVPVGAFAGIAHPESFFRALRLSGVKPDREWAFPDHHKYGRGDICELLDRVGQDGIRVLVTTEKDFVRLPSWFQSITLAAGLELDFGADHSVFREALDSWTETQQTSWTVSNTARAAPKESTRSLGARSEG